MKRKLPTAKTDRQAAALVTRADLTKHDLAVMKPMRFEFEAKEVRIDIRVPGKLLDAIKVAARQLAFPTSVLFVMCWKRRLLRASRAAVANDERCWAPFARAVR